MAALVPCVLTVLIVLIALTSAGPIKTKTVDQRQQGELNIHAQLENIVIVLIPSSNLNLVELATKTKFPGDKNGFFQLFQKPLKGDIDRYEVINDIASSSDELPVISTQQVTLTQKGDKNEHEEEVVATVEEMSSPTTVKATDEPKLEPTEDSPIKEHSTVGETVQESVLKIFVPEDMKDAVKAAEEKSKETLKITEDKIEKVSNEKVEPKKDEVSLNSKDAKETVKEIQPNEDKERFQPKKETVQEKERVFTEPDVKTVKELIRPVAAKEDVPEVSGARLVEGARREKVIKYKPETKWAPGLVDLLKPVAVRPKAKELEERQRFAGLCAPGVWDTELQTCIMPGETRSRSELARFLQAMRFGIALPSRK